MNYFEKELQELNKQYIEGEAKKKMIQSSIIQNTVKLQEIDYDIEKYDKAIILLSKVSLEAKKLIVSFLENIVTDALNYISEGQYKFEINIDGESKNTKCEFYIVEEINGKISKQKPRDACGGGFIDIISTTLRYAYLNIYNNPKLCGAIILDEPGKMVSADMSIKFGEFIKKLGEEFNRQTIMITHNNNFTAFADKVHLIV